jgi:hypothetical protein
MHFEIVFDFVIKTKKKQFYLIGLDNIPLHGTKHYRLFPCDFLHAIQVHA